MTTRPRLPEHAVWFPAAASARTMPEAVRTRAGDDPARDDPPLATNGFLSSLLPLEDHEALRAINLRLTARVIEQCLAGGSAANQVDFGTQACLALAELAAHGVLADELLELSAGTDVVFPWSLSYGNARTPFNLRLVRLPLVIAFPRTVDDVVFWVGFVRDHGLSVSIRSGNNSYEGLSSSNQVVIDLTFLTLSREARDGARFEIDAAPGAQFEIDEDEGVVHAASGVRLGVLYTELARRGLALAGGQCAPVCVGGLVGTGGIGFLTRRFGWACDQLEEVEYVLADGRVVVANADNDYADLYRATKGAGAGGLGVMTRLTLRTVPAARVLFWTVAFNLAEDDGLADGAEVLASWQNLAGAPKALSSAFAATAATDGTGLLTVTGEYRVEDDDLEELEDAKADLLDILRSQWLDLLPPEIGPDRMDIDIREMSTAEAATAAAQLVPMPILNQWKINCRSTFRSLAAGELAPVFEYLRTHAPSDDPSKAVGYFNPWLLGGASNEIDPESAVVPVREEAVMWVHAGAQWNDPSVEADALAFVEGLWKKLDSALKSAAAFYGIPELELGSQLSTPPDLGYVRAYWSSPTHDFVPFLIDVKNRYDPHDLFRFAQSIPLAL